MKISIFGTGYVGLVTGACLAKLGHEVFCIVKEKSVIDDLNNFKTPFYEKGLDSLLDETLNAILFILIGLEIILIFESFDISYLFISILIILICVLSRFIGVKIPILLLSIKKSFEKNTALIITWGGLRGGLSVALALNLPDSIGEGKSLILFLTYAVVLFTILGQGLTIKKLIKE